MEHADISRHEGNSICGDDIMVYLKIATFGTSSEISEDYSEDSGRGDRASHLQKSSALSSDISHKEIIQDWSYDGNTSMITTAAASFFSELVVGKTVEQVLQMTYENTMLPEGFEVTPRRKRAGAIAILATRNALHAYLQDGKTDMRDDVVEI